MDLSKIRKALVAGGGAALGAVVLGLKTEIPQTDAGWVALFTGALGTGLLVGWGTWRVSNTPTIK